MPNEFSGHLSVQLNEIVENVEKYLDTEKNLIGADLTFGGGGHAFTLLRKLPNLHLIGVDQDEDAISNANTYIEKEKLADRLTLFHSNFVNFPNLFEEFKKKNSGVTGVDFVTIDLGVSSHQFDVAERGFSFREDGPLDMRMNYTDEDTPTAADLVNKMKENDLADLIYKYGEERLSRRIAKRIVEERENEPIVTTKQLENIIFHAYPANQRHRKPHPATRTFQALRIAVNEELEVISELIPQLFKLLNPGGIIQVISFHSLEDRIVKWSFKDAQSEDDQLKIITKKPILPTESEILNNPRARSAKLRVIQKTF